MTMRLSLTRNQVKFIVIIAMLIDHIAWLFFPETTVLSFIMHFIGRLTGPTMMYFIVEGYFHTRNVKKYALRLFIFGLISWFPFAYFESGMPGICFLNSTQALPSAGIIIPLFSKSSYLYIFPNFGVIYTFFLCLSVLWYIDKSNACELKKKLFVIAFLILSMFGDWPVFGICYTLCFYYYRNDEYKKWRCFSIITITATLLSYDPGCVWYFLYMLGIFPVMFIIKYLYNGESGKKSPFMKWFFYVFYPLHLVILRIIKNMI